MVGACLVMWSVGLFASNNQAPPAVDGVKLGIGVVFFVPCLVWFKHAFIPNSMEELRMRRQLWKERQERARLRIIREHVYYDDDNELPEEVLEVKHDELQDFEDPDDRFTSMIAKRQKYHKNKRKRFYEEHGPAGKDFKPRKMKKKILPVYQWNPKDEKR